MASYKLFKENPKDYLLSCYSEGKRNYEQIKERLSQSWKLYNGVSDDLQERAALNDGRANLFIHLIHPSIESRVATIVSEVINNVEVLNFKALPNNPNRDLAIVKAANCNAVVDFAMNMSDWDTKLVEWIAAAELYPLAFVKIYIDEIYADEPYMESRMEIPESLSATAPLEELLPEVKELNYRKKLIYRGPFFELLAPHEILYDYNVTRLEDSPFIIHRKRVDYFYLKEKYPDKITDELLEKQSKSTDMNDYAAQEEDLVGRGEGKDVKKNTYELAEAWIKVCDDDGNVGYKIFWFLPDMGDENEKIMVLDEGDPDEMNMRGVDHPFVDLVMRKRPHKLEGMSTADLLIPLQHELSDLHNQAQDAINYTLYPQLLQEQGAVMSPRQPTFSPREIWTVSRKDAIGVLHIPNINLQWIYQQIQLARENAQNISASSDFIAGSSFIKSDETLGEARIKHGGAGRRIGLSILQVYKAVRKLKIKMLKILQQTISPELEVYLTGGVGAVSSFEAEDLVVNVDIHIPTLPALADKALKQVQADRNYERLISSPLVASNPMAMLEVLRGYLDDYEYPPARKKAILDAIAPQVQKVVEKQKMMEMLKAMGINIPEVPTETETKQPSLPHTPENLAASVVG